MSIIHDALKKVQNSMEKNPPSKNLFHPMNEKKEEILPSVQSNKANSARDHSWLLIILSFLIIGISAFWILLQIQNKDPHFLPQFRLKNVLNSSKKLFIIPRSSHKPQTVSETATRTISTYPKRTVDPIVDEKTVINLQGIMTTENKNVALINNRIYEEGKAIGGVKILKINLNSVLIEEDGQQNEISLNK